MGETGDVFKDRADEEGSSVVTVSQGAYSELVSGQWRSFNRFCGGFQPQSEVDYEKSIRFPVAGSPSNRSLSYTWRFAGTGNHPQILLKTHNFLVTLDVQNLTLRWMM